MTTSDHTVLATAWSPWGWAGEGVLEVSRHPTLETEWSRAGRPPQHQAGACPGGPPSKAGSDPESGRGDAM